MILEAFERTLVKARSVDECWEILRGPRTISATAKCMCSLSGERFGALPSRDPDLFLADATES